MAVTQNTYTGNGSTTNYSFTFPYLETTDIKVSLNGTVTTAYTLANATTIQFNTAPANGAAIRIYRQTDDAALAATFYPGSAIRSQDLNENFTQNLYVTQESINNAATANTTANTALTNSNTAISTANSAVSTANTASSNASAAVSTANTASSNASAAVSTANTASSNATTAVNTANAATATANSATSTANTALSTANAATSTANAASTAATNAVNTANAASSAASSAVSTANTASTNASNAVTTANTASTNATTAVNTANTAVTTANAAAAAVANAVLYTTVANVAAIPASPANNTAIEVTNSTGIESFTPLSGLPVGFVGSSGLSVRIIYQTTGSTWTWIQYFPNDPESRYLKLSGGTLTGQLRADDSTSVASPVIAFDGDTNTGVAHTGADELALVTGGSARLTIDGSGNVAVPGTLGVTGAITGSSTVTGTALIPSGSTAPTNGVYLPAANSVAISTGGSGRLFVASDGKIGIGSSGSGTQSARTFIEGSGACPLEIDATAGSGGYLTLSNSGSAKAFFGFGSNIGTASVNDIAIRSQSGALAFQTGGANERLRITSAGLVGVGTSAPTTPLSVRAVSNITTYGNVSGNFSDGITGSLYIQHSSANVQLGSDTKLSFGTGVSATTALTIDTSQRVGIGTTSPLNPLHIAAAIPIIRLQDTDGGRVMISCPDGHLDFEADSDNVTANSRVSFKIDDTERARIDSSGRLLVGTSTGTNNIRLDQKIAVVSTGGNFAGAALTSYGGTSASVRPVLDFNRSRGTTDGSMTAVAADDFLGTIVFRGSDGTQFVDGAFVQALVDGSVSTNDLPTRLVFSTTADGASSPTERMRIHSTGSTTIGDSNASQSAGIGVKLNPSGQVFVVNSGGDSFSHYSSTAGAYRFYVQNGGTIAATSSTITVISDQRFKENIRDLDDGLNKILALQPRKFDWKEGKGLETKDERGFIAQEFEQIFPDLITEWKDPAPEGEEPYKAVRADLIPVLVKAIQEQQAIIEGLEARLSALESA